MPTQGVPMLTHNQFPNPLGQESVHNTNDLTMAPPMSQLYLNASLSGYQGGTMMPSNSELGSPMPSYPENVNAL